MLFTSATFLYGFLPLALAGYFIVPARQWRNGFLLAASLFFYAWGEGAYAALLLVSIGMNYGFGLWVHRTREQPGGRRVVALAVSANLGLLGAFKYSGFFTENVNAVLALLGAAPLSVPPPHLPIGLSFFTFQALSYVFDVYIGRGKVQRNPLTLALYIALFPQLILGPIVRYREIAGQLAQRTVTQAGFAEGVGRFIVGLGKKVLIADTLAIVADRIFALPSGEITTGLAWLGVSCFNLQLYFDFSGYADMAIGLGRMFGFRFRENFNYPMVSRSRVQVFQRWHISFFSWMRDYVYRPLCGRQCSFARQNVNILIVFFLAGLWHGASWTFIAWGLLNGALIVMERIWLAERLKRWWAPWQHAYVLSLMFVSNTFFRATTLVQAWVFVLALVGLAPGAGVAFHAGMFLNAEVALALVAGAIGVTPIVPRLRAWRGRRLAALSGFDSSGGTAGRGGLAAITLGPGFDWLSTAALIGTALLCAIALSGATLQPFIYFRF